MALNSRFYLLIKPKVSEKLMKKIGKMPQGHESIPEILISATFLPEKASTYFIMMAPFHRELLSKGCSTMEKHLQTGYLED